MLLKRLQSFFLASVSVQQIFCQFKSFGHTNAAGEVYVFQNRQWFYIKQTMWTQILIQEHNN